MNYAALAFFFRSLLAWLYFRALDVLLRAFTDL